MTDKQILDKTRQFVRKKLSGDGTGHDWWHIVRVVNTGKTIAKKEGGNPFVIELAALLHDIADWKFHEGDSTIGPKIATEWLNKLGVKPAIIEDIAYIVQHISFKGGTNKSPMKTIEGRIVQDADRLDAIGAIGIARTFAFGGAAGREIYNPKIAPAEYKSFDSFKSSISKNTTINHFYEKLLLLKGTMNTKTGKSMARNRHQFMEEYLMQFYSEWNGKK